MVGSTVNYNEVIQAIELVTDRKMLVKQKSVEELGKMIKEDASARLYSHGRLHIAKGATIVEPTLSRLFSHIMHWAVSRYWNGVKLEQAAWAENNIVA
ncbi:hypothetical protein MMC28_011105 [Mycoblastus sanguinarius]|nr:hypothetical protein [Mycoblastus sanguinarius]